jgi:hypothetical protein
MRQCSVQPDGSIVTRASMVWKGRSVRSRLALLSLDGIIGHVRSTHQPDIMRGSLTWLTTISQALLMLPGLYDAVWLGQLGSDAQAAAGLTMSVRFMMMGVLMALSTRSGALEV